MKKAIKAFLRWSMPSVAERIHTVRLRRHIEHYEHSLGLDRLAHDFVAKHGHDVRGGPFAGLTYVERSSGSAFLPKLVGSYESELHPIVQRIIDTPYQMIVDVGCAEGYYAVGLAKRKPDAVVYAYDIDDAARERCAAYAAQNQVGDRVKIHGHCDAAELNRRLQPPGLVICDCEGFEYDLLDPNTAPSLRRVDILVELHEPEHPGVTRALLDRFGSSHEIQIIDQQSRDPAAYPILADLPVGDQALAVNELRSSPQQWAFMTVKK